MCKIDRFFINTIVFSVCLILSFIFSVPVKAEMFYDNSFENASLNDWVMSGGTGLEWHISDKVLNGITSRGRDISLMLANFNKESYKVRFKAINYSGVDQNIILKSSPDFSYHYILGFRYNEPRWSQDNNRIVLYKHSPIYGYQLLKSVTPSELFNSISLSQNIWHNIEIQSNVKSFKVYFDGVQIFNVFDGEVPYIGSGGFGFQSHGGNFPYDSKNSFDDLKIMSLDHVEISPTPVPFQSKNKIIIIPGLGTSWNTAAMLSPIDDQKREWKMAPFVKNYDVLVKAFEDKGFVKNQDFFVWNYDWRKPLDKIVSEFGEYVGSLNIPSDFKINIVGHSLGGVVGRVWAQENNAENIGKVITLGSPNSGSVDAYEAWNGAIITNNFGAAKIGLNLLLQLQKTSELDGLNTIRTYAPVLKDLLPVFDFVKKNGSIVLSTSLSSKNDYLNEKNLSINSVFDYLEAVAGLSFESKEFLNLGERNIYDKVLGYWPDGSVLGFSKTNESDGTVLKKSAVFVGDTSHSIDSKHNNLPIDYVAGVFDILGLGGTDSPIGNYLEEDKIIFFIGSPAYLDVMCDDGILRKSDEMGFVVVDKGDIKKCKVDVVGTDSGIYHLVLGNSSSNNGWLYFEDKINNLETKTVEYDVKNGQLTASIINRDFLYAQLINDVTELKKYYKNNAELSRVLKSANSKNINNVIADFFKFRKKNKDYKRTAAILDEIAQILKIENKNISFTEAAKANKKLINDKSLVDRTARLNTRLGKLLSEFGANSYRMMDEKSLSSKKNLDLNNFADSYADSVLGSKLSEEVW